MNWTESAYFIYSSALDVTVCRGKEAGIKVWKKSAQCDVSKSLMFIYKGTNTKQSIWTIDLYDCFLFKDIILKWGIAKSFF